MNERVVVITGCSSGIGLAAAVEFSRRGWVVAATMRDLDRSGRLRQVLAAAGLAADICEMDVADDESVSAAVASIGITHGAVDCVVSNAGVGIDGTTEELTLEDFRVSFDTNVLGSVRLLHALLPAWRQRRRGRFIAVSSMAGVIGTPFNDAYCASKFALEGLLESLHPVAAQHGIRISVVEPGPVTGEFAHRHGPPPGRTDAGPYAEARARFQAVQDAGYRAAETNEEVAIVLGDLAGAEDPAFRTQSSEDVARVVGRKIVDLTGARVTGMTSRWI